MDDQNPTEEKKDMPAADVNVEEKTKTEAESALAAESARIKTEKEVTAQ